MCFDFFTLGFGADDHGARFLAQFLWHLIRHGAGFRIKVGRNKAQAAHPHLHTAGLDLPDAAKVRFDKRQCRAHRFAVCRLCRQIFRADFGYCRAASAGRANHVHCVCKNFRLIRFNRVAADRIHRRSKGDRLAVNRKHRFVTGISRKFLHMIVVISERHRKAIHLDAEPLFEQFLGTDDFVLDPFLVVGPGQLLSGAFAAGSITEHVVPFAQILVRG